MFGPQFDYLRVSATPRYLQDLKQSVDEYIKDGSESLSERRIFRRVDFDEFERQQIGAFKKIIRKYELQYNPQAQTDDVLLRFLYAGQFNLSNSLEVFKGYLNWLNLTDPFFLTAKAKNILEEGFIYLAGRDNHYRPSIVINAYLFDFEVFDSDSFLRALYNLLAICEDYMFYPGKIENVIVFVETREMNLIKFPYRQLQIVILQLLQNFPQMLHKMFIFNPSKSLMATWDYMSTLIDSRTLQKIELVKTSLFSPTANGFDASQVEERFGGGLANVQQFWMPLSTINQPTRSEPEWRYEKNLNYKREQPYPPSQLYDESEVFASHNYQFYREPSLLPEQKQQEMQEQQRQQEDLRRQQELEWEKSQNIQYDMQYLFGMSGGRQGAPARQSNEPNRVSNISKSKVTFQNGQASNSELANVSPGQLRSQNAGDFTMTKSISPQQGQAPVGSAVYQSQQFRQPNQTYGPGQGPQYQSSYGGGGGWQPNDQFHLAQSAPIQVQVPLPKSDIQKSFGYQTLQPEPIKPYDQSEVKSCAIM